MKQLSPKATKYFFYKMALMHIPTLLLFIYLPLGFVVVLAKEQLLSFLQLLNFWSFLIPILILYILFFKLWARLTYKNYLYELTDKSFRKERGIIGKKYVDIPYSRIQNIDIHRGLLARILGLSDIYIQTAGISGQIVAEGTLPALDPEEALKLRDELISRIDNKKDQGL